MLPPVVKAIRRPKKDETAEIAERESTVAVEHICKFVFHVTASTYAWSVMQGRPWVPWYLGGADSLKAYCLDYPFTVQDQ